MNLMLNKNSLIKVSFCMAILVIFILFASESFITSHIHHDCTGKDCPVCAEIHLAEAVMQQLSFALRSAAALAVFLFLDFKIISAVKQIFILITPINRKVRLND